jgi:hypothetical protein
VCTDEADDFEFCEVLPAGAEPVLHLLVEFVTPLSNLALSQALGDSGRAVVLVVVLKAKKGKIAFRRVAVISVKVSNLTLLYLVFPLKPEAKAASATTPEENSGLNVFGNGFSSHQMTARLEATHRESLTVM